MSQQFNFGSGDLILIPNTTLATPVPFNALQDFELDFKFDKKTLHGQKQFPLAVARGKGSITGKFKDASVNGGMFNSTFFGDTSAVGQFILAVKEAGSVPAATTYTITVSNSATFVLDCGVIDAATGSSFVKVASSPAAGEYSEAAGVYTFAEADASTDVAISYTYTTTSGGTTTTLTNKLMGAAPQFKAIYSTEYDGKKFTVQLNACQSDDLKMSAKNDDFMIPEISFEAFADAAGNLGIVSLVG